MTAAIASTIERHDGPGAGVNEEGGATMTTIAADCWHIPAPADAACAPAGTGQRDRLARIAALDGARMAEGLAFLAGYAPGVFDAVLIATEPCLDDLCPSGDEALEPYCTECGAKAGVFTARGGDWRHYAGDAEDRTATPFDADHAPVIGWRQSGGVAAPSPADR